MQKNRNNDPEFRAGDDEGQAIGPTGVLLMAIIFILLCGPLLREGVKTGVKTFCRRLVWHRFCAWGMHDIQRPLLPFQIFWKRTDGICDACFKQMCDGVKTTNQKEKVS